MHETPVNIAAPTLPANAVGTRAERRRTEISFAATRPGFTLNVVASH